MFAQRTKNNTIKPNCESDFGTNRSIGIRHVRLRYEYDRFLIDRTTYAVRSAHRTNGIIGKIKKLNLIIFSTPESVVGAMEKPLHFDAQFMVTEARIKA